MAHAFDTAAARRIEEAVRALETRSAAELVVEIRSRSGSYAHAEARFAALLALVSVAILLYMPLVVPPIAALLGPIAFYAAGIAVVRHSDAVRRLFTTARERAESVKTHAAATFHQSGIANTANETGVLLYVSLLEKRAELLADRAVLAKVPATEWNALKDEHPHDEESIIAIVNKLAPILEQALPASPENPDELTDELQLA